MQKIICLFIIIATICSVFAQFKNCNEFNGDCAGCTQLAGCGYCYATGICEHGVYTGPASGKCLLGWYFDQEKCPNCTAQNSCEDCNATPSCQWCSSSSTSSPSTCQNASTSCLVDHLCDCRKHLHCSICMMDKKCSWCSDRDTCESTQYSTCKFKLHTCPNCGATNDCEVCNGNYGCTWCVAGGKGSCTDNTLCNSTNKVVQCSSVCNTLNNCADCARAPGCGWCKETSQCYGGDTQTSCLITHTCPGEGSSFSASSFVGGIFLVVGIVCLGVVGFFGYKYYQKRKVANVN